jgi:hypothetical protein
VSAGLRCVGSDRCDVLIVTGIGVVIMASVGGCGFERPVATCSHAWLVFNSRSEFRQSPKRERRVEVRGGVMVARF